MAITATLAGCVGGDGDDGDGTVTEAQVDGPITVGQIIPVGHPLEGPIKNGANFYIDQLNEQNGGLLGAEIEYVNADSKLSAEGAQEAAKQLVQQEEVDFLMGPLSSEWTIAVQETVAGNDDIIYIDGSSGTTVLNDRVKEDPEQYGHWFTNVPRSPQVFRIAGDNYANHTAPVVGEHAVVVREDLGWNANAAEWMRQGTPDNIEVSEVSFSFDTEDFSTVLSQAEDTGADCIVGAIAIGDGAGFVSQWAQNETPMPLDGFIPETMLPNFPDQVGQKAAESVANNLVGANAPLSDITLDFVEAYQEKYGNFPPTYGWLQSDSVRLWAGGVQAAGTLEQDAVIEALETTTTTGATGELNMMGLDDEFPHGPMMDPQDGVWYSLLQWQRNDSGDLERFILGPDDWADHDGAQEFILPQWMR